MRFGKRSVAMVGLYGVLPIVFLAMGRLGIRLVIPALIAMAGWCIWSFPQDARAALWDVRPLRKHGWGIAIRFIPGAMIAAAATRLLIPEHFMSLPRQNPRLWVTICVLYPLLSVYPQEIIYRAFFIERATQMFPGLGTCWLAAANAIFFGFAHIVFWNIWALLIAAAGGFLFALTYAKSRSVACVCVEHALWGVLVFTVGLGAVFRGGTVANLLMR